MQEALFQSLRSGAIILLTVNRRLSRRLAHDFDMEMMAQGETLWQTPEILPLTAWMETLRKRHIPAPPPVSRRGAAILFDKILRADPLFRGAGPFLPRGIADGVTEACRLIQEYGIRLPAEEYYLSEEARGLKRWVAAYQERLAALDLVDDSAVRDRMIDRIGKGEIDLPQRIVLAGFDEITPGTAALLKAILSQGCEVDFYTAKPPGPGDETLSPRLLEKTALLRYPSEEEEVLAAARWVRRIFRPGLRLGIVIPDMNRYRGLVERIFTAELAPGSLSSGDVKTRPFNLSLGRPLYDDPLIRTALDLLSVDGGPLPYAKLSALLLSPYLSGGEESLTLARIDAELRRKNTAFLSLKGLRGIVSRYGGAPRFSALLDTCLAFAAEKGRGMKRPGQWAEMFSLFLQESGFASQGIKLESFEYQALAAWREAVSGLAALDDLLGRISKREAIGELEAVARETLHQPETDESPVEIMGLLESAGLDFDHVRLIGVHEGALPPPPSPNPFIPLPLQKSHNLPRSGTDRELAFARVLLNRLLSSTETLTASYPADIDGRPARPSPLFRGLEAADENDRGESLPLRYVPFQPSATEEAPPEAHTAVSAEESAELKGGTAVLKNQSDCPFRAFAVHRLRSEGLRDYEPGVSPRDRGNSVHRAMEYLWEQVGDSGRLAALSEDGGLAAIIAQAASEGVSSLSSQGGQGDDEYALMRDLERERLEKLLTEWVGVESGRPPFRVAAMEEEGEFSIGDLTITGRIDRIDELEDGRSAIIDYKTGTASPRDWNGERPADPQLMLYAVRRQSDAAAFALMRRGRCSFSGTGRADVDLPGVKPAAASEEGGAGWESLLLQWEATIGSLAEGFMQGEAAVDPRNHGREDSACRYCDQAILCRVFDR